MVSNNHITTISERRTNFRDFGYYFYVLLTVGVLVLHSEIGIKDTNYTKAAVYHNNLNRTIVVLQHKCYGIERQPLKWMTDINTKKKTAQSPWRWLVRCKWKENGVMGYTYGPHTEESGYCREERGQLQGDSFWAFSTYILIVFYSQLINLKSPFL